MSLKDVAKRAGVSSATVSRVLNKNNVVRNATRLRVMNAVEELNYHPNLHARTLAGGKSRTLAMIVSNLENPFSSTSSEPWKRTRMPIGSWWLTPNTAQSN